MILRLKNILNEYLTATGMSPEVAKGVTVFGLLLGLIIILWFIRFTIRRIIISTFNRYAEKSKTPIDDILVTNRVPRKISNLIPLAIAYYYVPILVEDFIPERSNTERLLEVIGILIFLLIFQGVLNSTRDYLNTLKNFRDKPIRSYVQVFSTIIWVLGSLSMLANLTGIPFTNFITTLGAASAVILLIFKDSILGFVASIQVSINDMVRIGDWITFNKYGADGDVVEINLVTVKVQNFDLTITTIPTYALIADSFKNWRGMQKSKGRRIKRAIYIKQNSIKYLNDKEVSDLKKISLVTNYLEERQKEIKEFNESKNVSKEVLVNGRNLTNLGVYRKYLDEYLKQHSGIHKEMLIMVRQLEPTTQGIPIEIYAFSKDKRWENYEYIMADVLDHIIPAATFFDLELFELPSNSTKVGTEAVTSNN